MQWQGVESRKREMELFVAVRAAYLALSAGSLPPCSPSHPPRHPAAAEHYAMVRAYSSHRSLGGSEEQPSSATAASAQQHNSALVSEPADEYCYKDPQGVVQGPFARQDIIDWCAACVKGVLGLQRGRGLHAGGA